MTHKPARHRRQKQRENARQVRLMAYEIADQAGLELLLDGAAPVLREAMLKQLIPFLRFTPESKMVIPDCLYCGFHRGSMLSHECVS
jgi:hypothetical protein